MDRMMEETDVSDLHEQNVFLIINRQIVPLSKKVTRFGRQLDNDVVFHDETVSRTHAEIRLEGEEYVLYDSNSTAGTYVNSKRISRCALVSSDLISLSHVQLMFVNNNAKLAGKAMGVTRNLQPGK
jgi:pSer/pThr/pTyr-binding forkhead associated (FHA) protein